ncbi:MAG TPA: hypothetical protein VMU75_00715, partial [Acidimicrobiales bacterium]|nr:hypothetical protein [Acidimicrobiales bacterium]
EMSSALVMVGREALMLAVIAALGSWPATFLPRRFGGVARLAMAPVLGLCAGTGVFTTLVWFVPASDTYWLVPLLGAASLAGWTSRAARGGPRPKGRHAPHAELAAEAEATARPRHARRIRRGLVGLLQILVVCVAVAGPITYAFAVRQSVGPVGYYVGDAQGYVAETDGMQHQSIRQAVQLHQSAPENPNSTYWSNISQKYWSDYANGVQEMDATPLSANLNELVGLGASDTQSSYLIAFLLAGALGVYAAMRYATRRASWAGVLAGALFGGAFFLQLFFDGSEGAITGLAVIVPLGVLVAEALRSPRLPTLVLLALLTSGLVALYPLFVPAMVIGVLLTGAVLLAWRLRRGRIALRSVGVAALSAVSVGGLAAVFNLVATSRAVQYWLHVLHGTFGSSGLPQYGFLKTGVIPSWLYQARQFYDLAQPGGTLLARIGLTIVVPVLLTVVLATGLRRHVLAWLLLAVLAGASALGAYERVRNACGYCADRNLLPIGAIVAFLVCVGIAALVASASWWLRGAGVLAACVAIAAVGPTAYSSLMRYRDGSYFLEPAVRTVIAHLPSKGVVELESFGESSDPSVEMGLVYMFAEERAWNRVSLPADYNENGSLIYLDGGALPLTGPEYRPDYRYVMTAIAGVHTARRVLARDGAVALQERVAVLDVTPDYGLNVASSRTDPGGIPRLNPYNPAPIKLIVTGASSQRVFVNLRFYVAAGRRRVTSPAESGTPSSKITAHQVGRALAVCVEATGTTPLRTAYVNVAPLSGVALTAMGVTEGRCGRAP